MTKKEARAIALRQATAILLNYGVDSAHEIPNTTYEDAEKITKEMNEIGRQLLVKAERFGSFNPLTGQ